MKTRKLLLDVDDDDEKINIGLLRVVKALPEHELFYGINRLNSFNFSRLPDLTVHGRYYDYQFSRYEAYYPDTEVCLQCLSNKTIQTVLKEAPAELFSGEEDTRYLLPAYPDADYILKASEPIDDFSVILLPENLVFHVQNFLLSPSEELYQLIQYYE